MKRQRLLTGTVLLGVAVAGAVAVVGTLIAGAVAVTGTMMTEWLFAGGGLKNTSHQDDEAAISPACAVGLQVKWQTELDGSISAMASADGGAVFVPDWGGSLHRLDAAGGAATDPTMVALDERPVPCCGNS